MSLDDFASNVNSYSGEDGMIAEICSRMGLTSGFCVEFGADDGYECSNTALLRSQGWSALLIEGNPERARALQDRCNEAGTTCLEAIVGPRGVSIDDLLDGKDVDLMSIDVDGDDYFIFEAMRSRPKIVLVEYNQSVPWFLDVRAAVPGNRFGASALSFHRLALSKNYRIVGATETNLIMVDRSHLLPVIEFGAVGFSEIMQNQPLRCGFVVSDYTCHLTEINMGNLPRWGARTSEPKDELVVGSCWFPQASKAISERFARERVP